jgi:HEAT repeat protein
LLETQPSPAGIEAARVLARKGQSEDDSQGAAKAASLQPGLVDARAYLRGALLSGAPRVRSQAAIAVTSLSPDPSLTGALLEALQQERNPEVRLQLARALGRRDDGKRAARKALEKLLEGDGMPAVQAASMLAKKDHDGALDRLRQALSATPSLLRRTAARAMARDARRPDAVREALEDDDPFVRIYAAGGILVASED